MLKTHPKKNKRIRSTRIWNRGYNNKPFEGVLVGESRDKRCWRVQIDGNKSVYTYHKSFIQVTKSV